MGFAWDSNGMKFSHIPLKMDGWKMYDPIEIVFLLGDMLVIFGCIINYIGGGFKFCSRLLGTMIQCDQHCFFRWVGSTVTGFQVANLAGC